MKLTMKLHPRSKVPGLVFALALAGVATTPALAQDEAELLEQDPLGIEAGGLKEKEKAPEPVLDDPDAALLKQVDEARRALEQRINTLQKTASTFEKIEKGLGSITDKMLKAVDGYVEAHATALSAYREAVAAGDEGKKKKLAADIGKRRKDFLKALAGLEKAADKLEKEAEKLGALVKAEEAEKPAEPPAEDDE